MKLKMTLFITLFAASNLVANICVENQTIWPIRFTEYFIGVGSPYTTQKIEPNEKASTDIDLLDVKTGYKVELLHNGEWILAKPGYIETSAAGHRYITVTFQTTDTKTGEGIIRIQDKLQFFPSC